MLSVPLCGTTQVVGVLNVQTARPRTFTDERDRVPARRSRRCSPGSSRRAASRPRPRRSWTGCTALDAARAELLAVVTHELRTPLAVVRAYVDLLG